MKIRKATEKDIQIINKICKEGLYQEWTIQHSGKHKKAIREDAESDLNFNKKTINKNLSDKKQCWIVLEEEGEVIGFGSAYLKDNKGIIESVYIAKSFQRKGYGKKILESLIDWLKPKKLKYIETNVLIKNEPSIKLHKKAGFKPYILRMRLK